MFGLVFGPWTCGTSRLMMGSPLPLSFSDGQRGLSVCCPLPLPPSDRCLFFPFSSFPRPRLPWSAWVCVVPALSVSLRPSLHLRRSQVPVHRNALGLVIAFVGAIELLYG